MKGITIIFGQQHSTWSLSVMIDFIFITKFPTLSISSFFIFFSSQAQENSSTSSTKKKNKFVSLYNKEGQDRLSVILPGRHSCECLAQKHKLINNCISCGRIVCEQEGSGPCLFCGSLVIKSLWVPKFLFFYFTQSQKSHFVGVRQHLSQEK